MKYIPVIGLEVHVELNTKSKMFCRCSADYFGKDPNSHTCPICLGLPGALPFINQQAIEGCIKIGLALNCKVNQKSLFERKNYFYPDLPKGYQISQYRWPLCVEGFIEVEGKGGQKKIRINRAHQEEDTGKLTHFGGETLIDFNRSGVPLVEIVTEPDFEDTEQVKDYARKLQQVFRYLGVSNADMERGDMRLEANVSVRPENVEGLPNYRVELKNINSFNFVKQAIEYEIKRQTEELKQGRTLHQETRGWDEMKKETYLQRSKEEANDYRYFPEPDLPQLFIEPEKIQEIKDKIPELPWDKMKRFTVDYAIKESDAKILTESLELARYFEDAVSHGQKHNVGAKEVANYMVNKKFDIENILPTQVIEEILGKKVGVITDQQQLEKFAQEVISENQKIVTDFKSGKENAIQALIGQMMKKTLGKADITMVTEILKKMLQT